MFLPKERKIIKILPCFNRDQNEVEADVADFSNFLKQEILTENIFVILGMLALFCYGICSKRSDKELKRMSLRSCVDVLPGNLEDNEWTRLS